MEYIFGYFYIVIWNLNSYFYIPKESESDVAQLCLTRSNPMNCSLPGYQAPPSMGFSRQEYTILQGSYFQQR